MSHCECSTWCGCCVYVYTIVYFYCTGGHASTHTQLQIDVASATDPSFSCSHAYGCLCSQVSVSGQREYERGVRDLGLHPANTPLPVCYPVKMNFSSMVPAVCRMLWCVPPYTTCITSHHFLYVCTFVRMLPSCSHS